MCKDHMRGLLAVLNIVCILYFVSTTEILRFKEDKYFYFCKLKPVFT